jgi:hypothetical protein
MQACGFWKNNRQILETLVVHLCRIVMFILIFYSIGSSVHKVFIHFYWIVFTYIFLFIGLSVYLHCSFL